MPAALVWPYEWFIIAGWWVVGLIYLIRIPNEKHSVYADPSVSETGPARQ
ncbi:hypothetical protein ACFO8Q_02175 [Effusibacillus consociatus]|uniref:Uncharacterized protein n=1 Tax=Effusibacillus consociatus TaxID=1117041 RepID=A0ABV9PYT4_9BACL